MSDQREWGADQVTVVIPTKDRPAVVRTAVVMALEQEGVRPSVVVVDDGSRQPLAAVGDALWTDPRVKVLRNEQAQGVCRARNRGLEHVSTPWVAFLDDDDLWAPGKLRRQLDALARTGHAWACSASVSFTGRRLLFVADPPPADDVSRGILMGNYIPAGGSGVLASTALVREAGAFDPALASLGDWDCWIRLAQKSPLTRVTAPDIGYHVHPTGMAHDVPRMERELAQMQAKYAALRPPLLVRPDTHFLAYLARLEYSSGNRRAGLGRTRDLLLQQKRPTAVLTPLRDALPGPLQAAVRQARLRHRARRRPDQDWGWLIRHLTQTPA